MTKFLVGESQTQITKFKPIFDDAVNKAKDIAQKSNVKFYEISEVRFFTQIEESQSNASGCWIPDDTNQTAKIKISQTADPECLTHEVGHSLFHPSPLHDRHREPKYGEKFCNAFRYFVNPNKGQGWMQTDGGCYDASKLICKCPNLQKFGEYFADLCQRKRTNMSAIILLNENL